MSNDQTQKHRTLKLLVY